MIEAIQTYIDDQDRIIHKHTEVIEGDLKDRAPRVRFIGQQAAEVPEIKRMVPVNFEIEAKDAVEAYAKFQEAYEKAKPIAIEHTKKAMLEMGRRIQEQHDAEARAAAEKRKIEGALKGKGNRQVFSGAMR